MLNFKPRVLQCNRFILKTSVEHRRVVKDFEIDLYLGSERNITVDGRHYTAPAGAIVYRRPGELVVSRGDYDCYVLTLDLSGEVMLEQQNYSRNRGGAAQDASLGAAFADFPTVFMPKRLNDIRDILKRIASFSYPNIINEQLATLYTEELLYLLLAEYKEHTAESLSRIRGGYIEKICSYINKHYKRNITIDELSLEISLNKNYMIRLFKERMGKTPINYLIETRLFYSSNMLLQTTLSVGEIAAECGFNSTTYFTKVFKEHYRETPMEFRRKRRIM